jgi:dTDP-4-dehydrorhamnose reductase
MRILVTGAGGQLARALPAALGGHELAALTRAELDVTDADAVAAAVAAHRPDLVVNTAAYNAVDQAETDREAAFRANALGPRALAAATADAGAALLHLSSDYVFDGAAGRPYDERDPPRPLSVYGETKLAGEDEVRRGNPRHYVVRTSWLYAPHGRNFPLTVLALGANGPVRVVADQHGSPTYVPHLAEAIGRLISTGAYGTYHLAGGGHTTWHHLARTLFALKGLRTDVQAIASAELARPARRPAFSALATVQEPRILLPPWEDGLRAFAALI